jgi:hypothetical protein
LAVAVVRLALNACRKFTFCNMLTSTANFSLTVANQTVTV